MKDGITTGERLILAERLLKQAQLNLTAALLHRDGNVVSKQTLETVLQDTNRAAQHLAIALA